MVPEVKVAKNKISSEAFLRLRNSNGIISFVPVLPFVNAKGVKLIFVKFGYSFQVTKN